MTIQSRKIEPAIRSVAVVGTGVIGRSWVRVFSRAGCKTRIYDAVAGKAQTALSLLEEDLHEDVNLGVLTREECDRQRAVITVHPTLREAVYGVGYVQESASEQLAVKKQLFRDLDTVSPG